MIKWKYGIISDGFTIGGCDTVAAGTEQIKRLYEIDKLIGGYHSYQIYDPKTNQFVYSKTTDTIEQKVNINYFR